MAPEACRATYRVQLHAGFGLTEAAAREAGYDVEVHKHAMVGNGRAMILGETDGLVKVVAQRGGRILGFHMVGPWASELMHEGYLAVNWDACRTTSAGSSTRTRVFPRPSARP